MSTALETCRAALIDREAWLVGGALRDRLLGRPVLDVDLAVAGDVAAAAQAVRAASGRGAAAFALSDAHGGWRVVSADRAWHADLVPLAGGGLEADLRARDVTLNAMAVRLGDADPSAPAWPLVDPLGGEADLERGVLRACSPTAMTADPLRVVRLARLSCELGLAVEDATRAQARAAAPGLDGVAGERIFAELVRVLRSPDPVGGLELLAALDAERFVLPELTALRGVEQNRYHHADVHGHTLEVLEAAVRLSGAPGEVLGDDALDEPVRALLDEPLGDGLTRGDGLRLGCLLHDAAKPATQIRGDDGAVAGFPGHDRLGADVARSALERLRASEKVRAHVAALAREHLQLGWLVKHAPLDRGRRFDLFTRTEPVEVDVCLLSVCDRLATRGRKGDEATAAHLALARDVLPAAFAWRAGEGSPPPLIRGDDLARAVGREPGPWLADALREVARARYVGDVGTAQDAVALVGRSVR